MFTSIFGFQYFFFGVDCCKMKVCRVENILKDSLDSIPSPSVKIQIVGGKVCLKCKGKLLLGVVNELLKKKIFSLLLQVNFPKNT